MKSIFVLFIIISLTKIFPQDGKIYFDANQLSNSTVLLFQKINSNNNSLGTGTLISQKNHFFILTANHVAKTLKNDAVVVFRIAGDRPLKFNLLTLSKQKVLLFKNHSIADISMIEVFPQNNYMHENWDSVAFPIANILGTKTVIDRKMDFTYFGFPIIDLDLQHFSPLIFSAKLASGLITHLRADTKTKCDFYYLNEPSIQGCSGSAVYISVYAEEYYDAGRTFLVGIVHGTYADDTGGKMAAITPSYYITELLKLF